MLEKLVLISAIIFLLSFTYFIVFTKCFSSMPVIESMCENRDSSANNTSIVHPTYVDTNR